MLANSPLPVEKAIVHSSPLVTVDRDTQADYGTLGILKVSGNRIADTLELPERNNAEFVSRIVAGLYKLEWLYSKHFRAMRWHITGVPGRSAIELHNGNTLKDTDGCILLGLERVVTPDSFYILQSVSALSLFDTAMKPYRTTDCSILITDPTQRSVV